MDSQIVLPSDGVFTVSVWPTYVGVMGDDGVEPISSPDYERGSIKWTPDVEDGKFVGYGRIVVPAGTWSHVLYCYHVSDPRLVCPPQPLAHPFILAGSGTIDIFNITEQDFRPELRSK